MTRPACNCEGIQILGELEPGHTNECAVARWMVEEAPFAWRCERCGVLGGLYFADTEREAMADGLQHHRDKHGPAILVGPNPRWSAVRTATARTRSAGSRCRALTTSPRGRKGLRTDDDL